MITSQKQLMAAKEKIRMLRSGLKVPVKASVPKVLRSAALGQTKELLAELETEVKVYEALTGPAPEDISIGSLEDLLEAPIRYRLAKHLTIEEFARKVGIHSRQIARYESTRYRHVTMETLLKILRKLQIKITGNLPTSA